MEYRCMLLVVFAVLLTGTGIARADWQDAADRHADANAPVEDNPAWDDYAFDLEYADGSANLTFHDLARTGQPFVLFFWLTDCPVCHLQLPYMKMFDESIRRNDLGIKIVSINLDDTPKDALDMFKDKNLKFDLLIDPHARRTDKNYNLRDTGTPVAFVFDETGMLVKSFDGFNSDLGYKVLTELGLEIPDELDKK